MRKLILGLAATIGVLATLGLNAPANAAVAVENGVGHVDKGDVQRAFDWNNGGFDTNVPTGKEVTFSAGTQVMGNETRWQCADGVQSQTSLVTQKRNVTAVVLKSSNGRQITGWDLTGMTYEYVSGKRVGAPYVGFCPTGGFSGFLPNVFTTDVTDGDLKVTIGNKSVALPNTPVPAV